jgi:nucleotide-binding universal stress UspA family protein
LGIDDEERGETKGRYKFPYGDFQNVHRCGVFSAESRAGQYKYYDIENAAAHLRVGKPDEEILRVSEEIIAGLIVVENQGFGRKFSRLKRFLMGRVSERVTTYARCSVLVVRRDLYNRPPA